MDRIRSISSVLLIIRIRFSDCVRLNSGIGISVSAIIVLNLLVLIQLRLLDDLTDFCFSSIGWNKEFRIIFLLEAPKEWATEHCNHDNEGEWVKPNGNVESAKQFVDFEKYIVWWGSQIIVHCYSGCPFNWSFKLPIKLINVLTMHFSENFFNLLP